MSTFAAALGQKQLSDQNEVKGAKNKLTGFMPEQGRLCRPKV
jgi:hypothetical protein